MKVFRFILLGVLVVWAQESAGTTAADTPAPDTIATDSALVEDSLGIEPDTASAPQDSTTLDSAATPKKIQIFVETHGSWEHADNLQLELLQELSKNTDYKFQTHGENAQGVLRITQQAQQIRSRRKSVFFWLGAVQYTHSAKLEYKASENEVNSLITPYSTTISADTTIGTGYCGLIECHVKALDVNQRLDLQKSLIKQWVQLAADKLKFVLE
ncbi:MAG: hypothetical protein GX801_07790 [Fibrobacter sp.]|nr:hypothetical protein [Fibrobacter sp.]